MKMHWEINIREVAYINCYQNASKDSKHIWRSSCVPVSKMALKMAQTKPK
jgi:hypothetical protein